MALDTTLNSARTRVGEFDLDLRLDSGERRPEGHAAAGTQVSCFTNHCIDHCV